MKRVLQSSWFVVLVGGVLYMGVSAALLRGLSTGAQAHEPRAKAAPVPSWEYSNPELEQLIAQLKRERVSVKAREQELEELATRLQAERAELNLVTQAISRMQEDMDKTILRVRDEEAANLKKLARTYATMAPDSAANIVRQMTDDQVTKFLVFMKEDEAGALLESLAKVGEAESKRAALITEKLRVAVYRKTPTP